jgi:RNA polymerase sigma-70 factor, ECF subfamily
MKSGFQTQEKKRIDIRECYAQYGPMVLRRCRALLRNEDKAFDSMQEVFEKLLLNVDRLDGSALSSLLYRMATNLCLNKIRDERNHEALAQKIFWHNLPNMTGQEYGLAARNLLEYILDGSEKTTHRIAVMYFVDGMTLNEIAAEMDISTAGVHKRLSKVQQMLKKMGGQ